MMATEAQTTDNASNANEEKKISKKRLEAVMNKINCSKKSFFFARYRSVNYGLNLFFNT